MFALGFRQERENNLGGRDIVQVLKPQRASSSNGMVGSRLISYFRWRNETSTHMDRCWKSNKNFYLLKSHCSLRQLVHVFTDYFSSQRMYHVTHFDAAVNESPAIPGRPQVRVFFGGSDTHVPHGRPVRVKWFMHGINTGMMRGDGVPSIRWNASLLK